MFFSKKKQILLKKREITFFHEKKYSLDLDSLNDLKKFNLFYFFNKKKSLVIGKNYE